MHYLFRLIALLCAAATSYGVFVSPAQRLPLYNDLLAEASAQWAKTLPPDRIVVIIIGSLLILGWIASERYARAHRRTLADAARTLRAIRQAERGDRQVVDDVGDLDPEHVLGQMEHRLALLDQQAAKAEAAYGSDSFLTRLATLRQAQQRLQIRVSTIKANAAARDLAALLTSQSTVEAEVAALENDGDGSLEDKVASVETFVGDLVPRVEAIEGHMGKLHGLQERIRQAVAKVEEFDHSKIGVHKLLKELLAQQSEVESSLDNIETYDNDDLNDVVDTYETEVADIEKRLAEVAVQVGRLQAVGAAFAGLSAKVNPTPGNNTRLATVAS